MSTQKITIIGAGISGMILALTLHSQNISSTIYELRQDSTSNGAGTIGGAIMTGPNALKILDRLGLYATVRTQGFNFESLHFKDAEEQKTTEEFYFGHEQLYGYKALRIYRYILLGELKRACQKRGIVIHHGMKFTRVIDEVKEQGVTYEFADGTTGTADFLVAADGIHSTVRKYLYPDLKTQFQNFIGVTSAVPKSLLRFPGGAAGDKNSYELPATLSTARGAFVLAPQNPDGEEVFVGRQVRFEDLGSREAWDALTADKKKLKGMMLQDYEVFPDLAKSAMDGLQQEKMNIWPFYSVPELEHWMSNKEKGSRVLLIGDAAHALPPTTGQGANQAIEDAYTLGLLLSRVEEISGNKKDAGTGVSPLLKLATVLPKWQAYRESRVLGIRRLTTQMNNKRMPLDEQAKMKPGDVWKDEGPEQMSWLYAPDLSVQMWEVLAS